MAKDRQANQPVPQPHDSSEATQTEVVPNAPTNVTGGDLVSTIDNKVAAAESQFLRAVGQSIDQRASDTADQAISLIDGYSAKTISYTNERVLAHHGGDQMAGFCSQLRSSVGARFAAPSQPAAQLTSA